MNSETTKKWQRKLEKANDKVKSLEFFKDKYLSDLEVTNKNVKTLEGQVKVKDSQIDNLVDQLTGHMNWMRDLIEKTTKSPELYRAETERIMRDRELQFTFERMREMDRNSKDVQTINHINFENLENKKEVSN